MIGMSIGFGVYLVGLLLGLLREVHGAHCKTV